MTQFEKLLTKFQANPTTLRFAQIEKILLNYGLTKKQAKGSHVKFKYEPFSIELVIPLHNGDCKNEYKRIVARILKKYF